MTTDKTKPKPARINDDPTRPTFWRPLRITDTSIEVWEERDRLHIAVTRNDTGATLAEWWDDDARQLFEDGFLKSSTPGRLSTRDRLLHLSAIEYLEHLGIL